MSGGEVKPWALSGDKYSPNLAAWSAKNGHIAENRLYRGPNGTLWIGWIDDGAWFIGSRLWQVLCTGRRAQVGCWTFPVSDLTEVPDFWAKYARLGRCAIDTDHTRSFVNDDNRWDTQGDIRSCRWCGFQQTKRRWTEVVTREAWGASQ